MSDIDVESYIGQLRQTLPYVPPIPVSAIKALHKKRDFGGIVRLIRKTMNVGVNLTVHWSGGPPPKGLERAKAWIELPEKMSYFGTPDFKKMKMDIFVLKSFRDASGYEEFAMAVAHELSHVVLESTHHPLRAEEKAVDLTAMLLGFSYLYRNAAHVVRPISYNRFRREQLGYLSLQELEAACRILIPFRMRARRAILLWAAPNALSLVFIGFSLTVAIFAIVSSQRNKHQLALAEAARIQGQAPKIINSFTVLDGAHAGLSTVTSELMVTIPTIDPVALERTQHAAACAENGAGIQRGLSYVYEYRTARGADVARVEVSSCP